MKDWQAIYKKIDINGAQPEVAVTVSYVNQADTRSFDMTYMILPEDVNGTNFKATIKTQIELLAAKDQKLNKMDQLINNPIEIA